jgi:leucyl aminopeptidase
MRAREVILEVKVVAKEITQIDIDAIVVGIFEGENTTDSIIGPLDSALQGAINALIARGEIKAKFGEIGIVHTLGNLPSRLIAIAGLGKLQNFTLDRVRGTTGEACRYLRKLNCHKIAMVLHSLDTGKTSAADLAGAITEGSLLGLYSFQQYKKSEYEDVEELLILAGETEDLSSLEQSIIKGKIMAEAVILARDMVNEPSNQMTPSAMATIALEISERNGLRCTIFDSREIESMGMNAFLAVAKGSSEPAKLVKLEYQGDEENKSAMGFIGKGITFDSGGISIKPSENMGEMKDDMSGGAAVMAAMGAIAQLKPRINVTAIVPATENMPGGTAFKPGDILRAMNGKTIEVMNTDAEGRLILADALSYAVKEGLSPLVDVATLTGACCVALGKEYSGAFTNDQETVDTILQAAGKTGEDFWQMPLPEKYREMNKSLIADVKNTGNRYGGAITAALFLSEFVGETPWVHLDIAGPAFSDKERGYIVKGATGVGVRTLVEMALAKGK